MAGPRPGASLTLEQSQKTTSEGLLPISSLPMSAKEGPKVGNAQRAAALWI